MKDDPHVLLFTKPKPRAATPGYSWWLDPKCQTDRGEFMAQARAHHPDMSPMPFYNKFPTDKGKRGNT